MVADDGEPLTDVTVWADYGCCLFDEEGFALVTLDRQLPRDLAARLHAWENRFWDARESPGTLDADEFDAEGIAIAVEIKRHLGPNVRVTYKHLDHRVSGPIEQ